MDSKTPKTSLEVQQDEPAVHIESAVRAKDAVASAADAWSGSRFGEAHVAYLDLATKVERRRQEGQSLSPVYRVYLRDRAGNIVSGRTIAVENDEVAIKIASILLRACGDVCAAFEVWQGEKLVVGHRPADLRPAREELSRRSQQIVIDTEIALRDSHAALAESRQLLDAIDEWQGVGTPARHRRRS